MPPTQRAGPPSRTRPVSASPTMSPSNSKSTTARLSAPLSRTTSSSLNHVSSPKQSVRAGRSSPARDSSTKGETDQREQLLMIVQTKDQTIATLTTENNNLTSALNSAEARVNDLYADQSRAESELAQRIDIAEKLRTQIRELEREKRDIQRRYNEQTASFEAERQAFYDNEQHLKSRIQSLSDSRKRLEERSAPTLEPENDPELEEEEEVQPPPDQTLSVSRAETDENVEPAEMTSLRLELSTLSTSYASLQSTLLLHQTQLVDLKRVNRELQEENESYMILLREKTLSGQFDIMAHVSGGTSDESEGDNEKDSNSGNADVCSLRSPTKSTLHRVEEELSEEASETEISATCDRHLDIPNTRQTARSQRKRVSSSASVPRGESLADLPITGPGLDLAAELGRAENKDIADGTSIEERDHHQVRPKKKWSRSNIHGGKVSDESGSVEPNSYLNDLDALRTEVKSLKDANKALSLYASKIIDRIISQEGFEHVLAVDYDKSPATAVPALTGNTGLSPPATAESTQRPLSVTIARSASSPMADTRPTPASASGQPSLKTQRRSLSFDWKAFSLFSGSEKKVDANLRPLTLKPGANPLTGGRKLDNEEDDEDRKERERLNATMKLMGIHPPQKTEASSTVCVQKLEVTTPPPSNQRRFSFFGQRTAPSSSDPLEVSTPTRDNESRRMEFPLTQDALVQAEAENSLAALDAQERTLSADIARGSGSGFTEISPRVGSRRSRRSAGESSGSTVWSAGMSGGGDED